MRSKRIHAQLSIKIKIKYNMKIFIYEIILKGIEMFEKFLYKIRFFFVQHCDYQKTL